MEVCGKMVRSFVGPTCAGSGRTELPNLFCFMMIDILGKSRHHQMGLGPPNLPSDFPQKLGAAGPAAFGENTF